MFFLGEECASEGDWHGVDCKDVERFEIQRRWRFAAESEVEPWRSPLFTWGSHFIRGITQASFAIELHIT